MPLPNTWNALDWALPLAVLAAVALLVILWTNWTRRVSPTIRTFLTILKTAAFALLCLCLLEPMRSFSRPEPGANAIVVMADASQSLNVKDKDANQTRATQLANILGANLQPDTSDAPQRSNDAQWLETLDEQFELRRYQFHTRLNAVVDFNGYAPDGVGSSIAGSLKTVAARLKDKPTAGIILLTDGNSSELRIERGAMDFASIENFPPVYPVVIGSEQPVRDLSITSVETTQTNFESAPVTIKTELVAHGHTGETVKIELLGEDRPREFGHSLTDLIGAQIDAGFQLMGFYEDTWGGSDKLSTHISTFFATRCLKS